MQVSITAAFRVSIRVRQIGHELWRIDLVMRLEMGDFGVLVGETLDLDELGDIARPTGTEMRSRAKMGTWGWLKGMPMGLEPTCLNKVGPPYDPCMWMIK